MFVLSRAGLRAVVLVAGALSVAACSGSTGTVAAGSAPSQSSSSASSSASSNGFQAYRDCLSQHGVTLPTRPQNQQGSDSSDSTPGGRRGGPGGGFNGQFSLPPGVDQSTFDAAQQACASLRPTGGGGGRNAGANAAYRSCLADHGVTVPSTSSGGPPPSIDRNDPKFAAANDACKALRPNNNSNSASTSSDASSSSSS